MQIRTGDKGREHTRELLIEEKQVAALMVIDHEIWIGSAKVSMAGIGGVHTRREHRMKGYMRALMEDTLTYVTAQGYTVSMLFGIEGFYPKFGYTPCLPAHRAEVQTRDAEDAKANAVPCAKNPVRTEDMAAILDLYNRNNAGRTCSVVRSVESFPAFRKGSWWDREADAFCLRDQKGKLLAYAVCDRLQRAVNVVEAECRDASLFPTLLYELAKIAVQQRCGHITLFMPPDHPFAEHVTRYGCKWTIEYEKSGGGVMRIIDQQALLAAITPELQQRVDARRPGSTGAVTLRTDLGTHTIAVDAGRVEVEEGGTAPTSIELSQARLIQLVTGYRRAADILSEPDVRSEGDVVPLLDALFPKGHPYVWLADGF